MTSIPVFLKRIYIKFNNREKESTRAWCSHEDRRQQKFLLMSIYTICEPTGKWKGGRCRHIKRPDAWTAAGCQRDTEPGLEYLI